MYQLISTIEGPITPDHCSPIYSAKVPESQPRPPKPLPKLFPSPSPSASDGADYSNYITNPPAAPLSPSDPEQPGSPGKHACEDAYPQPQLKKPKIDREFNPQITTPQITPQITTPDAPISKPETPKRCIDFEGALEPPPKKPKLEGQFTPTVEKQESSTTTQAPKKRRLVKRSAEQTPDKTPKKEAARKLKSEVPQKPVNKTQAEVPQKTTKNVESGVPQKKKTTSNTQAEVPQKPTKKGESVKQTKSEVPKAATNPTRSENPKAVTNSTRSEKPKVAVNSTKSERPKAAANSTKSERLGRPDRTEAEQKAYTKRRKALLRELDDLKDGSHNTKSAGSFTAITLESRRAAADDAKSGKILRRVGSPSAVRQKAKAQDMEVKKTSKLTELKQSARPTENLAKKENIKHTDIAQMEKKHNIRNTLSGEKNQIVRLSGDEENVEPKNITEERIKPIRQIGSPEGPKTEKIITPATPESCPAIESDSDQNKQSSNSQYTKRAGAVGLRNLGFTCYNNSVIQALCNTPAFRDLLLENEFSWTNQKNRDTSHIRKAVAGSARRTRGQTARKTVEKKEKVMLSHNT